MTRCSRSWSQLHREKQSLRSEKARQSVMNRWQKPPADTDVVTDEHTDVTTIESKTGGKSDTKSNGLQSTQIAGTTSAIWRRPSVQRQLLEKRGVIETRQPMNQFRLKPKP